MQNAGDFHISKSVASISMERHNYTTSYMRCLRMPRATATADGGLLLVFSCSQNPILVSDAN